MHKNFVEHKSSLATSLHLWLAPLSCALIMLAPLIRFASNFGLIVDAVGLLLLIFCIVLQGTIRPIQYLDRFMICIIFYLLGLVILSSTFVGTEMAFVKALNIFIAGFIFFITILAFNKSPDIKIFSIVFILLSFFFTALSFEKGLDMIYEKRLIYSFSTAISIFSIYALWGEYAKFWQKLILIGFLFPFIYWGTMSGNRSLFVIVIFCISFHYLYFHKNPLKAVLFFLPFLFFLGFIYWYLASESILILRILAIADTGIGREEIWSSSLSGIIQSFPMGAGISESYQYLPGFFWPHNIILELLLELGVFSIPIILALVLIPFLNIYSKSKEKKFFYLVFIICLLNFMKSFSLGDIRLLTLPLALLVIAMRKQPKVGLN